MILEQVRIEATSKLNQQTRSEFGQFMTQSNIAEFMANMFVPNSISSANLLDPGAGVGSLSAAFLDRWLTGGFPFNKLNVTAYEIDNILIEYLTQNMAEYSKKAPLMTEILSIDFIEDAVNKIKSGKPFQFTHAILNPPYKKINSDSRHRALLREVGIETVNLYSAFVALSLLMLAPKGQLVAIIPRSFCNGPYYRSFRMLLLQKAAIRHIHLFESRNKAFKDDNVLQENIIIALEKGGKQSQVTVSTSTDASFSDFANHKYEFEQIVIPDDAENFIHIPSSPEANSIDIPRAISYTLDDLGIKVSTGPVVDFRVRKHIHYLAESGDAPLLYPGHFAGLTMIWPKPDNKIPNAICHNSVTDKWLFPVGYYCVVRRFSSKEEHHRVMASVVDPNILPVVSAIGLENHLNVFHENKKGLPEEIAKGLAVFLNSTIVDKQFRRFNGHTQVNATDLRSIRYPSRKQLQQLGSQKNGKEMKQDLIDRLVGELK